MSDRPQPDPALLRRVLALTPVGREELRDPQSGLSLPQRWLLGHIDGDRSLATLAANSGSPPAERLPRDAARLVALGLALDQGEPGPSVSTFGPSTMYGEITLTLPLDEQGQAAAATSRRRRAVPVAVVAAAVLAVVGGAATLLGGTRSPAVVPVAQAASVPPAAAPAPVPASAVALEVMPNAELSASEVLQALTVTPRPAANAAAPAAVRVPAQAAAADVPRQVADSTPAPVPAAVPVPVPVPVVAAAPAPAPVPTPVPTPALAAAPAPAPQVVAPAVTPLVAAAPAAATVAPPPPLRPLSTVEPSFPREGLGLGARAVLLQARLTIAPNGSVTQVSFPQAGATTRPFERAARAALLQWRFPEGSGERSYAQQLRFSEE